MRHAIQAGLRPEPNVTVTKWADEFRILDSVSSAMPGKYRSSVTPYLAEIMDHLGDSSVVEEVIFMKGAQVGATEAALNWIGYTVQISPCPILLVEPTNDVIELVSKTRVQPMLESTPELAKKVKPAKSRDSGNTLTKKEFPGGILRMTGANSASALRNMPVKRLILDEVDAYPLDLDGEGNPIDLAKKRTSTFSKRKIFILSTPTVKGISVVAPLFESTDQRYYHVPCPHCGGFQHLKWENLRYTYNKVAKIATHVEYQCEHCGEGIHEKHKAEMLAAGRWIATKPENQNRKRIGYHLNSMYSPPGWLRWEDMAVDYEQAQGDTAKMKTFVNTSLGLPYEEKGEKPEWEALRDRSGEYPPNKLPNDDIAFITVGVDVQKDRLELEVVGWAEGKISYSIDYRVLPGYVSGDGTTPVWEKLAAIMEETWTRPDGTVLGVRMMCVDSGAYTSEVYAFCALHRRKNIVPIKGRDTLTTIISAPKAVNVTRKNKSADGVKVWSVGVSVIKEELYGWLRLEPGDPGYCHFPRYSDEYFQGLISEEKLITKDKKGKPVISWVKRYARNEPLDCRVYARAAAHVIGMDTMTEKHWAKLRGSPPAAKRTATVQAADPPPAAPKKTRKRRSSYWD